MEKYDYDAIVIGAGMGGISCASILAKRGLKTIIFENHSEIGGCCSSFTEEGFQFDVGASIVEFVGAYDAIFERLGKNREDYIDFRKIDPLYSFRTPDGEFIDIPTDIHEMYDVIKQFSKKDAKNWLKYCEYFDGMMGNEMMSQFLRTDMQSFKSMAGMFSLSSLKYLPVYFATYEILTKKWFSHPKTLDTMGFQSYWIGLPPRLCPGTYAGIHHLEHQGIYYPKGGMISIPRGLLAVGQEYGIELKVNTRVSKVIIKNGKARGVELADGTKLSSKIVVSNVNAKRLYLELVGEEHLPGRVAKGVKSYALSIPMPMVYVGVKGDVPLKAHHSLQLTPYQEQNVVWDEGFCKGRLAETPMCLCSWTSKSDTELAPPGHHALNLGAQGPYTLDHGDWNSRREEYIDRILDFFEKTLFPGFHDQVVYKSISTPVDFERMLLSPQGAVYSLQNDIPSTMQFRPSNRSKSIEGLYLTGASTHPGGGVPMVTASGGITADLIEKDWSSL